MFFEKLIQTFGWGPLAESSEDTKGGGGGGGGRGGGFHLNDANLKPDPRPSTEAKALADLQVHVCSVLVVKLFPLFSNGSRT